MTLVSSGTIELNSGGVGNTNIHYEIEGTTVGSYDLVQASNNASPSVGSLPTSMSDFYGHTQDTAPSAPTKCNTTEDGTGVKVSWFDTSSNEDGFNVWYQVNGGSWIEHGNVGINVTSVYLSGYSCSVGDTVAGRVRAYTGGVFSLYCTDTTPVTTTCP